MTTLNAKTARDCIQSADELYEVLMLNTQDKVFEVLQVTHSGSVTRFLVVEYEFNKDVNMAEQVHGLFNIKQAELFDNAADARTRVVELVMQANFNA